MTFKEYMKTSNAKTSKSFWDVSFNLKIALDIFENKDSITD